MEDRCVMSFCFRPKYSAGRTFLPLLRFSGMERLVRMIVALVIVAGCVEHGRAQEQEGTYRPFDAWRTMDQEREQTQWMDRWLRDSTALRPMAVEARDLYGELTRYSLSFVSGGRRGYRSYLQRAVLDGFTLDRSAESALWLLSVGSTERGRGDLLTEGRGGCRLYESDGYIRRGGRLALKATDRSYNGAVRFRWGGHFSPRWSGEVGALYRTGRDRLVDGQFTQGFTGAFRLQRRWKGAQHLTIMGMFPFTTSGLHGSAPAEVFTLTGDPYYNPYWGYQQGEVRNARVRRERLPSLLAQGCWEAGVATLLTAAAYTQAGERRTSALEWFDALSPLPDSWRNLPSAFDNPEAAAAVEASWRARDARYTQIDWDALYAVNRLNGRTVYALGDRVERVMRGEALLRVESYLFERLKLDGALRVSYDRRRMFKQLRDGLGSAGFQDIDYYLEDDYTSLNQLPNDCRNRDRTVTEGDRYGYDYALVRQAFELMFRTSYRHNDRFIAAGVRAGGCRIYRQGYFEKGLFPGAGSYGRSRPLNFAPWAVDLVAGIRLGEGHDLRLTAQAEYAVPEADRLFLQPLYNNRAVDDPALERHLSADLRYGFERKGLTAEVTLYVSLQQNGLESWRTYDDLLYEYCDRITTGIAQRAVGVEASVTVQTLPRLKIGFAGSASSVRYTADPQVSLYRDRDNEPLVLSAASHMKGCTPEGLPQYTATVSADYTGKRWGSRLQASYAGGRSVEPDFMRRTERFAREVASSPEDLDALTAQEHLPDAFSCDLLLWKTFRLSQRHRLTLSLFVRNLTGSRSTLYGGYETSRLRRCASTGSWRLQGSRYSYAYARSFSFQASWRF